LSLPWHLRLGGTGVRMRVDELSTAAGSIPWGENLNRSKFKLVWCIQNAIGLALQKGESY